MTIGRVGIGRRDTFMELGNLSGHLAFSYRGFSDDVNSLLNNVIAKSLVLGDLTSICGTKREARCGLELARCYEAPHPVVPGQTVLEGTTLGRMIVFYKPRFGYLFEVGDYYLDESTNQRRLKQLYCIRDFRLHLMTRIWLGQNHGRVLLNCFVELESAIEIASYFCDSEGGRWPSISWQTEEEMDWGFYLAPEDDWPNEADPPIRPAWRVPLTQFETLRQQRRDWNDYF